MWKGGSNFGPAMYNALFGQSADSKCLEVLGHGAVGHWLQPCRAPRVRLVDRAELEGKGLGALEPTAQAIPLSLVQSPPQPVPFV